MEINEIVAISQYTLKSLAFEHYILQITLHNLHLYLLIVGLGQCANWWKQTSVTRYARVGFLPVLGSSKLLRFDGGPLELDGFTLSLMIRASNSSRLSWSKNFWSLCKFPFWRKWRWYKIQALILPYQWDARVFFGTSALSGMVFDTMTALCPPGQHLACFFLHSWTIWGHEIFFLSFSFPHHLANSPICQLPQKAWFKINHAIIDPLHSHYSRIFIITVIHSASAFFCLHQEDNVVSDSVKLYQ